MKIFIASYESSPFNGLKVIADFKPFAPQGVGWAFLEGGHKILAYESELIDADIDEE